MTTDEKPDLPTAAERLQALPDPPTDGVKELADRARRDRLFVIIASFAASVAMIAFALVWDGRTEAEGRSARNAEAAAAAQDTANHANAQASTAVAAAEEANRRLREAGKPTVPVPTISPATSPPPIQVEGLTGSQESAVRAIIANQLAAYQPTLSAAQIQQISALAAGMVPKPKDGHTPTPAELQPLAAAAQAAFCADGKCIPKPGKDGTPGHDGQDGKDAPPVTSEQLQPIVAAGITAYCGQDSKPCQGERGPAGTNGQNGYSVVDQDCLGSGDDSYWQITLNNGTDQKVLTAQGPCRIGPVLPSAAPLRAK